MTLAMRSREEGGVCTKESPCSEELGLQGEADLGSVPPSPQRDAHHLAASTVGVSAGAGAEQSKKGSF